MIPKIIHYCWFGRGEMPALALKCIESWKHMLPEYEIKEWNEDNFDLDMFPYTREAYDNRKFAFVTDVVRLYAMYTEGGVYMDTDVEVIKSLDPFLHHTAFSGFESDKDIPTGIMASEKGGRWAKENLDYYKNRHFVLADGSLDLTTNVEIITSLMLPYGLKRENSYQDFEEYVTFYPKDYFCPINHEGLKMEKTENTVCIHYFAGSWQDVKIRRKKKLARLLGPALTQFIIRIKRLFTKRSKSHVIKDNEV